MKYPKVSIAIPTYNSELTLKRTLKSIHRQSYPKNKIEVLIIDGGSKDRTIEIAKIYGYKIIPNIKTDLIFGKHLGLLKATGKYLMFLDSDEVLENSKSLEIKVSIFQENNRIKSIMSSGLKTPKDYADINYYINEFGEPFSFFMHGLTQNPDFYIHQMSKKGRKVYEDKDCAVFSFYQIKPLPIIEPTGAGSMVDLGFLKSKFPQIKNNPFLTMLMFYLLNNCDTLLAVTKNDPVVHYSAGTLTKYLKKISSRVKNNTYQTTMGKAGFSGREKFQPKWFKFKKYLFFPYSFSLIMPIFESLYFAFVRKNYIYLIHPVICIYTAGLIIYYQLLKNLNVKLKIKGYGN